MIECEDIRYAWYAEAGSLSPPIAFSRSDRDTFGRAAAVVDLIRAHICREGSHTALAYVSGLQAIHDRLPYSARRRVSVPTVGEVQDHLRKHFPTLVFRSGEFGLDDTGTWALVRVGCTDQIVIWTEVWLLLNKNYLDKFEMNRLWSAAARNYLFASILIRELAHHLTQRYLGSIVTPLGMGPSQVSDGIPCSESGWRIEYIIFGGAFSVVWRQRRDKFRLERATRFVFTTTDDMGTEQTYSLSASTYASPLLNRVMSSFAGIKVIPLLSMKDRLHRCSLPDIAYRARIAGTFDEMDTRGDSDAGDGSEGRWEEDRAPHSDGESETESDRGPVAVRIGGNCHATRDVLGFPIGN